MGNSQGLGNTARKVALASLVDGRSFKAALYLKTASVGPTVDAYTATGEVSGSGYTAGGVPITNGVAAANSGSTAYWTPGASISFGTVTLATTFDTVMIYDVTSSPAPVPANRNLGTFMFGDQTVSAAPFTLTMPTNDVSNALIRLT